MTAKVSTTYAPLSYKNATPNITHTFITYDIRAYNTLLLVSSEIIYIYWSTFHSHT